MPKKVRKKNKKQDSYRFGILVWVFLKFVFVYYEKNNSGQICIRAKSFVSGSLSEKTTAVREVHFFQTEG
jgi:hypothetical protein